MNPVFARLSSAGWPSTVALHPEEKGTLKNSASSMAASTQQVISFVAEPQVLNGGGLEL